MIISFSHAKTCDEIYIYNSDTNINNYKQLKIEFDRFFGRIGNYTFQPFDDKNIFEKQLKEKKFCMLILSSWYFQNLQEKLSLTPILIAHRKGVDTQQVVLITKVTPGNNKKVIPKGNLASCMSNVHSKALLKKILIDSNYDNNLILLRVPKDIDALMAVGFGMSTYALSTFHSFNMLSIINPPLYHKLTSIGKKVESPLMICAFLYNKKHNKLIDAFVNIDKIPEGKNSIKMLGIDGFKMYQKKE
ncbi:hypothetical protein MHK_010149 [Candidatus Magnetomorum sp. HK-1]|nr:hypothetical protein MHK_010149 [Candidatus Magnetomorum sp. HK-1]